jgi:LacI family transcriptional regulator
MTIGLLRAIAERGLRVPDDIALVAFGDFEWADLFAPHLTVIRAADDRARVTRRRASPFALGGP